MKKIPLTQGKFALVDDEDYDFLMQWKWHIVAKGYASRTERNSVNRAIRMHRAILDAREGQEVDHINGNRLDNRRANLRIATSSQNAMNRKKIEGAGSKYKGVCPARAAGKFIAQIKVNGKTIHLGTFASEKAAAKTYNIAAKKNFGEFARLNKVK